MNLQPIFQLDLWDPLIVKSRSGPTIISIPRLVSSSAAMATQMVISADALQAFPSQSLIITAVVVAILLSLSIKKIHTKKPQSIPSPPVVPGLPIIGNLHQLKQRKPHGTLTKWAEIYGPVYSIKTGASTVLVVNTTAVAREVMVTKFSSMSTWIHNNATKIISENFSTVATSDYNDFHRAAKRNLLNGFSGSSAQKQFRIHRDTMVKNLLQELNMLTKNNSLEAINVRDVIKNELFGLALKQALGEDLESSVYVEELGVELSRDEIFNVIVDDMMRAAIDVDWRDFFPYLRWIPNKSLETKIEQATRRRNAVMRTIVGEQKKRIASGKVLDSLIDFILSCEDSKSFTDDQVNMLIWEPTMESSDTTLVTVEWAMTELARNKNCQDLLYQEIRNVCGSDKLTEEHLPRLPYLNAIFHETLRKYSPAPLVPLKYVHEDIQLGGYHIKAGTEVVINIYGCNMDKKQWDEPEEWKPERFLDNKYNTTDLYKTMSFGLGKRVCAGAQQAMTISCMTIGTFVQEFQWSLEEGQNDDVDALSLTNHRLHQLRVFITQRM